MSEPIVRKVKLYDPNANSHREEIARALNQVVDQVNQGLILESPDGSRWRLEVDNSGVLSTSAL